MKKSLINIASILASVTMLCTATTPINAISNNQQDSIDALDILIASYKVLDSEDNSFWDKTTDIKDFSPLYDYNGEKIIAYYVGFEPSGYAIVNNNINNPVVLEFSPIQSVNIENLLESNKMICYTGTLEYSTISDEKNFTTYNSDYKNYNVADTFYEKLSLSNNAVASSVDVIRNIINNEYSTVFKERISNNGDALGVKTSRNVEDFSYTKEELREIYNIIDWDDLPSGTIDRGYVSGYSRCTWGADIDFRNLIDSNGNEVNNACTTVAAFNIITYYMESLNESDLYINDSRNETFIALYDLIGEGPVVLSGMNRGLINYVDDLDIGYSYDYSACNTYNSIIEAIESDHVCGVLLTQLQGWHTVMAYGYHQLTSSGEQYLRIADGWEDTNRMYILYSDTNVACETWLE